MSEASDRLRQALDSATASPVGDYTASKMKSLQWRLAFEIEPGSYEAASQVEELDKLSRQSRGR